MHKNLWYALLFFTGAASTAAEMVGLRLLAPVFGSSLPVWGAAIAIVIGGLAIGYFLGGRRAMSTTKAKDVALFAMIATVFFVWMPVVFSIAATWSKQLLVEYSISAGLAAAVASILGLLVPSVAYGMISPLASQVEATATKETTGHVTGRIFMLTTLGSLAGILLPAFVTIPVFGTKETVWIFAAPVLALGLHFLHDDKKQAALALAIATGVGISILPSSHQNTVVFASETPYQHVVVEEAGENRLLKFDAGFGIQSLYTPDTYTNAYWDYMAALPALLPVTINNPSVLVLGAGASTSERQMQRFWGQQLNLSFTSVEIDKELFAIAAQYFDPPQRKTVAADARNWLTQNKEMYDIIVIDTYTRELSIPFHLTTTEFFREVAAHTQPHGVIAMNINSQRTQSKLLQSLVRTAKNVWPSVTLLSVPDSCNFLVIASEKPLRPQTAQTTPDAIHSLLPAFQTRTRPEVHGGFVLTDNYSPVDVLGIAALLSSREHKRC